MRDSTTWYCDSIFSLTEPNMFVTRDNRPPERSLAGSRPLEVAISSFSCVPNTSASDARTVPSNLADTFATPAPVEPPRASMALSSIPEISTRTSGAALASGRDAGSMSDVLAGLNKRRQAGAGARRRGCCVRFFVGGEQRFHKIPSGLK